MLGKQQNLEHFEARLLERLRALKRGAQTPDAQENVDCVELALKRIGWGNYRLCAQCWEEIAEDRREEDPTRITCGRCASKKPRPKRREGDADSSGPADGSGERAALPAPATDQA